MYFLHVNPSQFVIFLTACSVFLGHRSGDSSAAAVPANAYMYVHFWLRLKHWSVCMLNLSICVHSWVSGSNFHSWSATGYDCESASVHQSRGRLNYPMTNGLRGFNNLRVDAPVVESSSSIICTWSTLCMIYSLCMWWSFSVPVCWKQIVSDSFNVSKCLYLTNKSAIPSIWLTLPNFGKMDHFNVLIP